MNAMEASVAHEAAFKALALAEEALEQANEHTPQVTVQRMYQEVRECQSKVKLLQARLDEINQAEESKSPVLGRKYKPRWRK